MWVRGPVCLFLGPATSVAHQCGEIERAPFFSEIAGTISIVDATQIHAATTQGLQRLVASDVLTAPGPGLDPSVVSAIRSEPGVAGAVGLAPTTVYMEPLGGPSASEAVTPGPLGSVLNLKVTAGSLSHFGPGDVALSTLIAGKGAMDAHVGEAITAYLADGTPYRAQVTAIFSRSAGFADVLIPTGAAGGGHLGTNSLAQVLVAGSKQTSPTALHSAIGSLAARYPGMQAASRSVANAQYELANSQTSYANNLLLSLVGLLAGLALVNTLVLVTLQGRRRAPAPASGRGNGKATAGHDGIPICHRGTRRRRPWRGSTDRRHRRGVEGHRRVVDALRPGRFGGRHPRAGCAPRRIGDIRPDPQDA